MAIVNDEDGIEVRILCDGQSLHEYDDPDLEKIPSTTTRFVVAETGRAFVVRCTVKTGVRFRGNAIVCEVFMDGRKVAGTLINDADCEREDCVRDIIGARTSPTTKRPFLFSDLLISECVIVRDRAFDVLTQNVP